MPACDTPLNPSPCIYSPRTARALLIDFEAKEGHWGKDPAEVLLRLFALCVPQAHDVFAYGYTPLKLLQLNDFVLEKAFVYGIICLSKWLTAKWFPQGVFDWPPQFPEDLLPKKQSPLELVDLKASTGKEHLPAHVCKEDQVASTGASSSKPS